MTTQIVRNNILLITIFSKQIKWNTYIIKKGQMGSYFFGWVYFLHFEFPTEA